jgi:hypothetical protein
MVPAQHRGRTDDDEESPADIVNAPDMTQAQKIEALDSWALDIERRLASTDEGMPGQGHRRRGSDLAGPDS